MKRKSSSNDDDQRSKRSSYNNEIDNVSTKKNKTNNPKKNPKEVFLALMDACRVLIEDPSFSTIIFTFTTAHMVVQSSKDIKQDPTGPHCLLFAKGWFQKHSIGD